MKPALLTLLMVIAASAAFATDDGGRIVGGVEAVLHEGIVTFTVMHPDAVSTSVKVFDLETDGMIFDSGPRARTQLKWPAGNDFNGGTRYLVTAWNAAGEVVVSQTAANKRQTSISEISFDTVPDNRSLVGPGEIDLLGDVNVGPIPGIRLYQNHNGDGGGIELYDEGGFFKTATLLPTGSQGSGQLRVNGPAGGAWLTGEQTLHGDEAALGVYGLSLIHI